MGNRAGKGFGETRLKTEQARQDQGPPGARRTDAGSGATRSGGPAPKGPSLSREPLPTRVSDLPPLPDAYGRTLRAGMRAIGAGLVLPDQAARAIDDHVRLLMAWNVAVNLSGIRDAEAIAREHVLDSLTALPLLRRAGIGELVDLGSGGGFPGLPLAAALPARRALLVDSIAKKARFLHVAVEAAGLADRVGVAATRAESLAADPRQRGHWQAVVSRAMGDLVELAELGLPLLAPGGLLVAWKRRPFDEELARARRAVGQLGGRIAAWEPVAVPGLEDHALAVVEKVAPTPSQFPRDPAARKRWPL
jgi:16S rRNA (guanine527-N7)-methyltransferase